MKREDEKETLAIQAGDYRYKGYKDGWGRTRITRELLDGQRHVGRSIPDEIGESEAPPQVVAATRML